MDTKSINNKYSVVCFCISLAFFVLLVASKSSFLYPFNDWVDVQCFYTVGEGMMNGLVPYKDLVEQKGPYVYLVYGIASMISGTNCWGGFILEVVAGSFFAYFTYNILGLYTKNYKLLSTTILVVITYVSPAFAHGGSVEELCLPLLAYGVLSFLKILFYEEQINLTKVCFINGIIIGVLALTKYTLLGVHFAGSLLVLVTYIYQKKYKELGKMISIVLAGILCAVLPWVIYFICADGLKDFWEWYFYNNLMLYSDIPAVSIKDQILNVIEGIVYAGNSNNLIFLVVICFVGIGLNIKGKRKFLESIAVLIIMVFAAMFIYTGGRMYIYYALPLMVVIIPGIGMLLKYIPAIEIKGIMKKVVPLILLGISIVITITQSENIYMMSHEKKDLPQYKFAEIINKKENATLLNYGFLDGGFYSVADILPSERYFCRLNVFNEELIKQSQVPIIKNEVDFVVIRGSGDKQFLTQCGYKEIDNAFLFFEGNLFTYYLYEKPEVSVKIQ